MAEQSAFQGKDVLRTLPPDSPEYEICFFWKHTRDLRMQKMGDATLMGEEEITRGRVQAWNWIDAATKS